VNEQEQKEQQRNERRTVIAMALDIAVKLTNAKHDWLRKDNDGNIVMDDPLYSTVKLVMRAISDDLFMAVSGVPKVVQGVMRETSDKSQM